MSKYTDMFPGPFMKRNFIAIRISGIILKNVYFYFGSIFWFDFKLFKKSFTQDGTPDKVFLLAAVKASFVKPIFPGDQLLLEIEIEKIISSAAMVKGVARVGDDTVAKTSFTFATSDKNSLG